MTITGLSTVTKFAWVGKLATYVSLKLTVDKWKYFDTEKEVLPLREGWRYETSAEHPKDGIKITVKYYDKNNGLQQTLSHVGYYVMWRFG